MVGVIPVNALGSQRREVALAEAPQIAHVTWYKDPGLRKLYGLTMALCLASATTGYDG